MSNRRDFLKQSALVSLAPLVPAFLSRSLSADDAKPDDRVLVVIQLDGGNDGLNTVIPFADEEYAKHRRELRIAPTSVLKLDKAVGLHPQMKSAAKLFEEQRLAIVQGVGYPNPNRSHFESMAIWHHARLDSADHDSIGWLGRAADVFAAGKASTASLYVGSEALPVALRSRRANVVAIENESDLKLAEGIAVGGWGRGTAEPPASRDPLGAPAGRPQPPVEPPAALDLAAFVRRTVDQSFDAARRLSESSSSQSVGGEGYPSTKLAQKLHLVSKLLKLDGATRIYYVSQTGYDTHSAQSFPHQQLLSEFSGALKAFLDDLREARLEERVLVMAFSEFGRRVEENGSAGTDHGVAGPVFLAGSQATGGLIGAHPSLVDLDNGDLRMQTDFRQVYATLLTRWLQVDDMRVLGGSFAPIDCLKST